MLQSDLNTISLCAIGSYALSVDRAADCTRLAGSSKWTEEALSKHVLRGRDNVLIVFPTHPYPGRLYPAYSPYSPFSSSSFKSASSSANATCLQALSSLGSLISRTAMSSADANVTPPRLGGVAWHPEHGTVGTSACSP